MFQWHMHFEITVTKSPQIPYGCVLEYKEFQQTFLPKKDMNSQQAHKKDAELPLLLEMQIKTTVSYRANWSERPS